MFIIVKGETEAVKKLTTFRYWMLRWFSQPKWDRSLYQIVNDERPLSILEIGLAGIERTTTVVQLAQRATPGSEIKYCGIDLFDARPSNRRTLKLKDAHCQLQKTNAKVRLMPGEFHDALPRCANQLGKHDLVIVSTDLPAEVIAPAWYFVPRVMADDGLVLLRDAKGANLPYKILSAQRVNSMAAEQEPSRRKAS